MAISNSKKEQTLLQNMIGAISELESCDETMQTVKSWYQTNHPDPPVIITAQQVSDISSLIAAVHGVITDHAATITFVKGRDVPSHGKDLVA